MCMLKQTDSQTCLCPSFSPFAPLPIASAWVLLRMQGKTSTCIVDLLASLIPELPGSSVPYILNCSSISFHALIFNCVRSLLVSLLKRVAPLTLHFTDYCFSLPLITRKILANNYWSIFSNMKAHFSQCDPIIIFLITLNSVLSHLHTCLTILLHLFFY